jgi:4-diphosphocytidyl-2-C-methyl-D-erythritol kinase
MAKKIQLKSPAKVNLTLEILRKREDGYHEIQTLLQKISLYDTIYFSLENGNGIFIETDHPFLPTGKSNLVYKAVQFFKKRFNFRGAIKVRIKKRIPLGSGLGGGSSNAAAALKALNQLLEMDLSNKVLMEIGKEIGADVAFFLFEGSAIGLGIGEKLKRVEIPHLWYVLIYPGFEVSTRWAYKNFLLTKGQFHLKLHTFLRDNIKIASILKNDLEKVVSKRYPEIETMKRILISAGALGASMTGSGPTVFGIFKGEKETNEAFYRLKKEVRNKGWKIFKAYGIN